MTCSPFAVFDNGKKKPDATANDRKPRIGPAESDFWKSLKNIRGSKWKYQGDGKDRLYYRWDYIHSHIEVADSRLRDLGSIDPITADPIRPSSGHTIRLQ